MIKKQKPAQELMPKDEAARSILQARAIQLAQQERSISENNGVAFIHFKLSPNEYYGVPYGHVQDILPHLTIARPPFMPNYIAGVINWRGLLITIVDLHLFFHPCAAKQEGSFIIVVQAHSLTLGLLVNQVEGSEMYQLSHLSRALSAKNIADPKYILGLHQSVTAILNVDNLVSGLSQEIKKSL